MIRNERKGFTLIEILIVVAIIAILASVVLVGIGPTQKSARDARRISDLRQVQNAAELYYNKCGYYPGGVQGSGTPPCTAFTAITTWATLSTNIVGSGLGITNALPDDPLGGSTHYFYGAPAPGTSYTMGATLENGANSALTGDIDGTSNGVSCDDPVYCLSL